MEVELITEGVSDDDAFSFDQNNDVSFWSSFVAVLLNFYPSFFALVFV